MDIRLDERGAVKPPQAPTERMERELRTLERVMPVRPVPRGDGARTLEERLKNDGLIVARFAELTEAKWQAASPDERRDLLQRTEHLLARAQGRDAFRVYPVSFEHLNIPDDQIMLAGALHIPQGLSFKSGFSKGSFIHIDHRLLNPTPGTSEGVGIELALAILLEESRHAYQFAVLESPSRFPEVDRKTVHLWQKATVEYYQDSKNEKGYSSNALEVDAKGYAVAVLAEAYGQRSGFARSRPVF
jgi:hypothetical protein